MRIIFLIAFLFSLSFIGCETVREGAQEVGKPLGAIQRSVGGVSEGAREAYEDKDYDNPYNR